MWPVLLLGAALIFALSTGKRRDEPPAPPAAPPLPANPREIVTIPGYGGKQVKLYAIVAYWFKRMQYAAAVAGFDIELTSGYRTKEEQTKLWKEALEKHNGNEKEARKYVAKPGSSQHEKGSAIDLWLDYAGTSENAAKIRETAVFHWLQNNANRFGFRWYDRTIEPWHLEWYYLDRSLNA